MNIIDIIEMFEAEKAVGYQLTKLNGILTSTWLIYKRGEFYYYFDINQDIEFTEDYRYSKQELIDYFKNSKFEIDLEIN